MLIRFPTYSYRFHFRSSQTPQKNLLTIFMSAFVARTLSSDDLTILSFPFIPNRRLKLLITRSARLLIDLVPNGDFHLMCVKLNDSRG
jgi:hypothetical protein